MLKLKVVDLFGVEIFANELADIIWHGIQSMQTELEKADTFHDRKYYLEYRINQGKEVHDSLIANSIEKLN